MENKHVIEIGKHYFSQHMDSILEQQDNPSAEPYYAVWGCGQNGKYDKRTATRSELINQLGK